MFKWRLYYEDGRTFSDSDGKPWESPKWGLVVVAQPLCEQHRDLLVNGHVYFWRSDLGCWMECENEAGERDNLVEYARHINAVRYGRWITDPDFRQIWRQAREEVDVVRKAAGVQE